jgi:signal transduction histidine kinase
LERIQAEEKIQLLNIQLEKRVEERTAALQEVVRELEAFSYSVSHDMRAPLRAMEGYTRKLLDDYPGKLLDDAGIEYLSRISRAAVRLDTLIQDVLTYTNVARGAAPLTVISIERLLQDLMATLPEWRKPQVKIEVISPMHCVVANEALLTQCVSHLVDNALKFVNADKAPRLRIWAELQGPIVRTWIEDNGPGIDPKDHSRIFRLFERIHPSTEFVGTGIGLTIVKKAVERMSGRVGFTSELGKGSKFWFELAAPTQI